MRLVVGFTLAFCVIASLNSCSVEEDEPLLNSNEVIANRDNEKREIGRFENEPFKWDYVFSTDTLKPNLEEVMIYPVKLDNQSRSGNEGGRILIGNKEYTSDILITDPSLVYVGGVFPESEFGKDFGKEITFPRKPIDVFTSFPDAYIGTIERETGSLGYKLFMKEVLRSPEYKNYLQSGLRESLDFRCSEFYSYSDIQKAFASNAGLGKIFSAKVQSNSRKTNIKSRLLGQLTSKNFTVSMDTPVNGFFKDRNNDYSSLNPIYVRSLTYGKIALLAIESEYSFEEVKKAVEAGIKFKIFSTGGNYTSKDVEILQKSTITIYVISDNTDGNTNEFFSSLDEIKNAFKISYSDFAPGLPIVCKGCYTKDNSVYKVDVSVYVTGSGSGNTGGGSRRGGNTDRGRDGNGKKAPDLMEGETPGVSRP